MRPLGVCQLGIFCGREPDCSDHVISNNGLLFSQAIASTLTGTPFTPSLDPPAPPPWPPSTAQQKAECGSPVRPRAEERRGSAPRTQPGLAPQKRQSPRTPPSAFRAEEPLCRARRRRGGGASGGGGFGGSFVRLFVYARLPRPRAEEGRGCAVSFGADRYLL